MALRAVQGDIRYLFNGLDNGNYRPQLPEMTWQVRYGDCKAKTFLLLAMLDGLGVEAEPVLAHTRLADFLPKRLPSAQAFDHILVRATIAGESYWLDGTGSGARLEDLADTPLLRFVLPLRAAGATLTPVSSRANARPTFALDLDVDLSAGMMLPAPFSATLAAIGQNGEAMRTAAATLTGDKRKEELDKFFGNFVSGAIIGSRDVSYDASSGVAVLRTAGVINPAWRREAQRYEQQPYTVIDSIELKGLRGRPEWREIPVATPGIGGLVRKLRLRMPAGGKGFTIGNDRAFPPTLAGRQVQRTVERVGDAVIINERIDEIGAEIDPADVPAAKAALATAKTRPLKLIAPADYPLRWQVVRAAAAAGRLKPIEAAYSKSIEDAAEKGPAFFRRAQYRAWTFDYKAAISDLDRAIAEGGEPAAYRSRANLLWSTGQAAKAIADLKTAYDMDPSAASTIVSLSLMQARHGELDAALVRLDERIEAGGNEKSEMQIMKAEVLMNAGQFDAAIAVLDDAIKAKPGDGSLLNTRCWLKGSRNVQIDTALKDCNRAVELNGENGAAATLHSRAMVYLRLGRVDEALADLDAAVDIEPELNDGHMLRGIIRQQRGDAVGAELDLTQARTADPRLEGDYKRYGIKL